MLQGEAEKAYFYVKVKTAPHVFRVQTSCVGKNNLTWVPF